MSIAATEMAWKYACDRINATPVIETPFPHIVVENVFPDNFYAGILDRLPNDSNYAYADERDADGAERYRGVVDFFKADPAAQIAGEHTPFWQSFTGAPPTRDLTTCLLNRFGPHLDKQLLAQRFGQELNITSKWLLTRDRAGYVLPPHNDTWLKVIAGLFYLPAPGLENDEGTTLLEIKPDREFVFDDKLRGKLDDFTVVQKLPYKANTMLAFVRSDISFHCVQELGAEVDQRDILLFNVVGTLGRFAQT